LRRFLFRELVRPALDALVRARLARLVGSGELLSPRGLSLGVLVGRRLEPLQEPVGTKAARQRLLSLVPRRKIAQVLRRDRDPAALTGGLEPGTDQVFVERLVAIQEDMWAWAGAALGQVV
jgi:hypothetical protein